MEISISSKSRACTYITFFKWKSQLVPNQGLVHT
jgi:hypothetical protein